MATCYDPRLGLYVEINGSRPVGYGLTPTDAQAAADAADAQRRAVPPPVKRVPRYRFNPKTWQFDKETLCVTIP